MQSPALTPRSMRSFVTAAIIAEADARRNWVDFLLFGIGPLEAASKALREHLQTTELTVDEIGEYRVAIKEAGDENLITAKTVEILSGVLDKKLKASSKDMADNAAALEDELRALRGTTESYARANLEKAEIVKWCKHRLSDYKRPKRIEIVEELPKTPSGKILKKVLSERG